MEYRRLGKSGLKVSVLSFGSWVTFSKQVDTKLAVECMAAAYDAGVNFFDNAEAYERGKSEIVMGQALKDLGWRRDSYSLSSKVFFGGVDDPGPTQRGLSRKHVVEACHQALERLQVDYLDLYFCHRPDPETPIEEVVWTMTHLIQQGKVLYWGTSEWSAIDLMEAFAIARQYNLIPPTMEQPHYNMFVRDRVEKEYARLYDADTLGLGTTTWSPLASGILTGKYNDGIPEGSRADLEGYEWLKNIVLSEEGQRRVRKTQELTTIADELGTNMARLAIAWCAKNPNVSTVITGASRVSQVEDNMKAIEVLDQLTDDVMERIEGILSS